ncbi:hypothetical protein MBAV_000644 [Candidatus Magnetobacterium bavaricum]|uniref:Uncharacterized protein n=1 Tax=Candidatus Magnetobacterium bavaricum TaxID=29290 RepID=A0A0F3GZ87_9BACT|nr:hypothetical protein MBAV_000644 [Candidatus Magnetobacterium bavaricum]
MLSGLWTDIQLPAQAHPQPWIISPGRLREPATLATMARAISSFKTSEPVKRLSGSWMAIQLPTQPHLAPLI